VQEVSEDCTYLFQILYRKMPVTLYIVVAACVLKAIGIYFMKLPLLCCFKSVYCCVRSCTFSLLSLSVISA